ncbi:hypothetical protein diail_1546 [Diaporthe ilicicola]|nr:hypothetical protein diail_1546 [Diaporthe ilicicola]
MSNYDGPRHHGEDLEEYEAQTTVEDQRPHTDSSPEGTPAISSPHTFENSPGQQEQALPRSRSPEETPSIHSNIDPALRSYDPVAIPVHGQGQQAQDPLISSSPGGIQPVNLSTSLEYGQGQQVVKPPGSGNSEGASPSRSITDIERDPSKEPFLGDWTDNSRGVAHDSSSPSVAFLDNNKNQQAQDPSDNSNTGETRPFSRTLGMDRDPHANEQSDKPYVLLTTTNLVGFKIKALRTQIREKGVDFLRDPPWSWVKDYPAEGFFFLQREEPGVGAQVFRGDRGKLESLLRGQDEDSGRSSRLRTTVVQCDGGEVLVKPVRGPSLSSTVLDYFLGLEVGSIDEAETSQGSHISCFVEFVEAGEAESAKEIANGMVFGDQEISCQLTRPSSWGGSVDPNTTVGCGKRKRS